jgi:hypothetical protein
MTDCVEAIKPTCQPSTLQVAISSFVMGASFRLRFGGEKPNRIRLAAPAFFTHHHPSRAAVVATSGCLPAAVGASGKVCAVGWPGAVGAFVSALYFMRCLHA